MSGQLDLFAEPKAHARRTDPRTSHEAARSLAPETLGQIQEIVLGLLRRYGPMTDVELAIRAAADFPGREYAQSTIRTRRSELVDLGLVEWTGRTARLRSGRRAQVWAATERISQSPERRTVS